MSAKMLHVQITDARGSSRVVEAKAVHLTCDCGCLHLQAGQPVYFRAFKEGTAEIELPDQTLNLAIRNGTARLTKDSLILVCESVVLP